MNSMEEGGGLNLGGGEEGTDKDEPEKEGQLDNKCYFLRRFVTTNDDLFDMVFHEKLGFV